MTKPGPQRFTRLLEWNARMVARFPWAIVLAAFALAAVVLAFTATHLGINTDTSGMIQTDAAFQRNRARYRQAFPMLQDNLVIAVTANSPEAARQARQTLEERLRKETGVFDRVYNPAGGEHFEKNGLLYLTPEQLHDLSDSVAKAQPFLSKLSLDPSLRGLFGLLSQAVEEIGKGRSFEMGAALSRIDATLAAATQGRRVPLSWQSMMRGENGLYDERYQILMAHPAPAPDDPLPVEPAMKSIRRLSEDLRANVEEGVRVRITGEGALGYEEIQTVFSSLGLVTTLSVGLVVFILLAAFRSIRLLMATLACLVLGLIYSAGFAAAAIGHLNMISVAFAVYYIGLGVTHSIHVCLRYREAMMEGMDSPAALREAILDTAPSLTLCALTTAIGFFAFIGTSYAGVSELGLISGTGMFLSVVISLTVLPAMLTLFPARASARPAGSAWAAWTGQVSEFPARRARAICWTASALGAASLFFLPKAKFDYNPINLRDPKSESVSTLRELARLDGGAEQGSIAAVASDAAAAKAMAASLSKLGCVSKAISIEDFIPTGQEEKLAIIEDLALLVGSGAGEGQKAAAPTLEEQIAAISDFSGKLDGYLAAPIAEADKAAASKLKGTVAALLAALASRPAEGKAELLAAAQRDLMGYLPMAMKGLSDSLQAAPVTLETLPKELAERWIGPGGERLVTVSPKEDLNDPAELKRFVRETLSIAPTATDGPAEIFASGQAVVQAFRQASAWALLAILALLLLVFRNVRDAMLVMVPLLLAAAWTGAASYLLDVPFNFANVIALPLLLGVGVDNGIHIVQRMRKSSEAASGDRASVSAGVFFSALTTLAAFANLAFAGHPGMASLGKIHSISISFGLLCVLVVLPALVQQVQGEPALAAAEPQGEIEEA